MLAAAGVSQRVRQSHMRHTDPRLTENTYVDERLLSVAAEFLKLAPIPNGYEVVNEPLALHRTGTDDLAQHMHKTFGGSRQSVARVDVAIGWKCGTTRSMRKLLPYRKMASRDNAWHGVTTRILRQRVKGLEPSTFTLATTAVNRSKTPKTACL